MLMVSLLVNLPSVAAHEIQKPVDYGILRTTRLEAGSREFVTHLVECSVAGNVSARSVGNA